MGFEKYRRQEGILRGRGGLSRKDRGWEGGELDGGEHAERRS